MIGETVGAYTIESELGRGGMGVVYLAKHRHLARRAAIKFLMRELSARADLLDRFFTEARAASLVEHDGIVRVFDCDVHPSGNAYIVMEYLQGQTLQALLAERGRLPPAEAAAIMLRVADALAAAHAKGIVHRDLKPENIFMLGSPPGAIKILDFGIAKLADNEVVSRTLSGGLVGTPRYMSPEQARGLNTVDAGADVYSLGCILFEMLCGHPPFVHLTVGDLIAAHIGQAPPPLDPSVPPSLRVLVEGMLAKSPDDRPALREEAIPMLQAAVSQGGPHPAPSRDMTPNTPPPSTGAPSGRGRLAVAMIAVATVVTGLLLWKPWQKPEQPASNEVVAAGPPALRTAPAPAPPTPAPPPPASESMAVTAPPAGPPPPAPPIAAGLAPEAAKATTATPGRRPPPRAAVAREVGPVPKSVAAPPAIEPAPPPPAARVSLNSDPPGAYVCLPRLTERVGITNGPVELDAQSPGTTFLLYLPGHHIERVTISAAEKGSSRRVKLRRLNEDDLQPPPPCR